MNALDYIASSTHNSLPISKLMRILNFTEEEIKTVEGCITSVILTPDTVLLLGGNFQKDSPERKIFERIHRVMERADLDFLTTIE